MQHIILASQSPRRRQLLELANISFEVVVKSIDEIYPPTMAIEEVPVYIARNKAREVTKYLNEAYHQQHTNKTVLAADTIVVINNRIIGKPEDRAGAIAMLEMLSGKIHTVITGVVMLTQQAEIAFAESTEVEFYDLTADQITYYVDNYQPYDKAGAYAIQEWIGAIGIKCIRGDYFNVMGLPVSRVVKALEDINP